LKPEADSPVLCAQPEAGDLIYAEGPLVGYRGYDRSGTEPLFLYAGRSSRDLRVNTQWCCDEIEASARYGGVVE
jgi:hypothetical protein